MSHGLQVWLDEARELNRAERTWLEVLLSQDFPGRDILRSQLSGAKVIGYCTCGCKSVNLKVPAGGPAFPYPYRVPVEMVVDDPPVLFLLHVVDGYVDELEVLRGDSVPIAGEIPLESARLTINVL